MICWHSYSAMSDGLVLLAVALARVLFPREAQIVMSLAHVEATAEYTGLDNSGPNSPHSPCGSPSLYQSGSQTPFQAGSPTPHQSGSPTPHQSGSPALFQSGSQAPYVGEMLWQCLSVLSLCLHVLKWGN